MTALFAYFVSYLDVATLELGGEVARKRPKVGGGVGTIAGICCCLVVVIVAVVAVVIIMRRRKPKV